MITPTNAQSHGFKTKNITEINFKQNIMSTSLKDRIILLTLQNNKHENMCMHKNIIHDTNKILRLGITDLR